MNPWAGLIIVVAILLFVIAWKGTQDNVLAALLNRPYGTSTVGGSKGGTANAQPAAFASLTQQPMQPVSNLPVLSV